MKNELQKGASQEQVLDFLAKNGANYVMNHWGHETPCKELQKLLHDHRISKADLLPIDIADISNAGYDSCGYYNISLSFSYDNKGKLTYCEAHLYAVDSQGRYANSCRDHPFPFL